MRSNNIYKSLTHLKHMNDEERLKAQTEEVHLRHIQKNSDRWDDFVKLMEETDIFNPQVFKDWKEIIIRLDKRIEDVKEDPVVFHGLTNFKEELQKIKEGVKDEPQPQVSIVSRKVHL